MKSKAMKNLLAELANKQEAAKSLMNKEGVTADEITKATADINTVQAKIKAQELLDSGKQFDEDGDEIKDTVPVNQPIYAQPNEHKGPFNTFGEQMLAVMRSSKPGAVIDNRLLVVQNASGANEGVPSEGGYLVQKEFSSEMLKIMHETSVLAPLCRKINIGANSNGIKFNGVDETNRGDGYRWGGVQAYWAAEAATVTASKPKFRQIELELRKLMALYYATDELLSDASALDSVLTQAFAEELQFKLDDAIFRGDGSGKPQGFMNSGALVTVAKETGQAADTIIQDNVLKMWNRMFAASRRNAVWLINQECEPQLDSMAFSIGTGGVVSPLAIEWMTKGTIKGRPVITNEFSAALGDLGDIALVDLGQYMLADKGNAKFDASMHVMFNYDEMTFRVVYRVDGQTARNSAITPYKGASTLSSFVTLAERA